jgi:hypothetical protein
MKTMRLVTAAKTARDVFLLRDRLHVGWIHAASNPAKVVDL